MREPRLRALLPLLLCLGAGSAITLEARGLSLELDDDGRVGALSLDDRPAPLLAPAAWDIWDRGVGLDETFELGLADLWAEDNEFGFEGSFWQLGVGWETTADDPPLARLTLAEPTYSDALRLIFPSSAQATLDVAVNLRKSEFSGQLRLGMMPLNALGQPTGQWVPFEPPTRPTPDGEWFSLGATITPPPTTALVAVWVSAEQAVGTVEVRDADITLHSGATRLETRNELTATDGGARQVLTANGLTLTADYRPGPAGIRVVGELATAGEAPRAFTIRYRVPLDGAGWSWWLDLDRSAPITEETNRLYANWQHLGGGHLISPYPLGCLTRAAPAQGLALATPQGQAILTRFAFRQEEGLTVGFDLGLAPALGHRSARFEFTIYPVDATWGMRSALARYYDLHADLFAAREVPSGAWFTGLNPAAVPEPARFGLMFDEQADSHLRWSRGHDLVALTGLMPWGQWRREGERSMVTAGRMFPPEPVGADAPPPEGLLHGPDGEVLTWIAEDGTRFYPWSTDPDLIPEGPVGQVNARLVSQLRGADERPLDGVQLDGLGAAWAGWQREDYTPRHLEVADLPLSFSYTTRQPVVYTGIGQVEYLRDLSERLRSRDQVVLGTLNEQARLPYLFPWLDAIGGDEQVPSASYLMWLRAMAYHKPVTFLSPLLLDPRILLDERRDLWQEALLYGAWPGTAGWLSRRNIDLHAALFDAYVPVLRELNAAGWEPIPYAYVNDVALRLERFGSGSDLYLVLRNPTNLDRSVVLTIEPQPLELMSSGEGGEAERLLRFRNRLDPGDAPVEFRVALNRWQTSLQLPARSVLVLTPFRSDPRLDRPAPETFPVALPRVK